MTLVLLLALAPVPASAAQSGGPATAEEALATYRQTFKSTRELDCPKSADPNDIVVCARPQDAPDPNRLPLPAAPTPGAPNLDEALKGTHAMTADACQAYERCGSGGLSISVDVIRAARAVKTVVERLIEGD